MLGNLQNNGFRPEDSCPNHYSDVNSYPMKPWNPCGRYWYILLKSRSFPIFVVYNKKYSRCKNNQFVTLKIISIQIKYLFL